MQKNKFTTYLIYAAGEIILVVIGILIAVALNNRNSDNLQRELEAQLLQEMVSDLSRQQEDLEFNIRMHMDAHDACLYIREALLSGLPLNDSLRKAFSTAHNFTVFNKKEGAYKTIISQGLTMISNDSLRFLITSYYEERIPFQREVEKATIQQSIMASENHLRLFKNFNWITPLEPWDYEALQSNREYLGWLSYNATNRMFEARSFQSLLQRNIELQEAIAVDLRQ